MGVEIIGYDPYREENFGTKKAVVENMFKGADCTIAVKDHVCARITQHMLYTEHLVRVPQLISKLLDKNYIRTVNDENVISLLLNFFC